MTEIDNKKITWSYTLDRSVLAEKKKCNGCHKLDSYNWLHDISEILKDTDFVQVRFKNTRKLYYANTNNIQLEIGDVVAVEASPGHDIGIVSMTGQMVKYQMKTDKIDPKKEDIKKIYRKAKETDISKWKEAIALEDKTMLKSREIANELKLNMKIGDVEFQGDKTKAIFYYIADDRVDFRELIKKFAAQFKIRVEMRQIGARQEAGLIGGIGSCGRELCCASWMKNFVSVTTSSARYQEVSLNPQKLAGQCSKLKCCLNYELEAYLDAQKDFPNKEIPLDTKEGKAYHQKTDVFKRLMWYSLKKDDKENIFCLSVEQVNNIIEMNKNNQKPDGLSGFEETSMASSVIDYQNSAGIESLNRFADKPEKKKSRKSRNKSNRKRNSDRRGSKSKQKK